MAAPRTTGDSTNPFVRIAMRRTLTALAAALAAAAVSANTPVYNANITEAEVLAAQTGWCNALVAISKEGETKGQAAAKTLAGQVIDAKKTDDGKLRIVLHHSSLPFTAN